MKAVGKFSNRSTVTDIFETHFPDKGTAAEKLRFAVDYAIWAPSIRNTQPWLFELKGDALDVRADPSRVLASVDGNRRDQIISCGAAVENICIVLRYFNQSPTVTPFPEGTESCLVARIGVDGLHVRTNADEEAFLSIRRRHTNRRPFAARELPSTFPEMADTIFKRHGVQFQPVHDDARAVVADLIAAAETELWKTPEYRRELAAWFGVTTTRTEDGLAPLVRGVGGLTSFLERWMTALPFLGRRLARENRQLAGDAPLLAVVSTTDDSHHEWLSTGRALNLLLLRARAAGLLASFFSQPIHHEPSRDQLAQLHGGRPQVVMAVGFAGHETQTQRAPRRSVEKVVVAAGAAQDTI